ncbi:hypothetical protein [Cesiribacter sp. SM1]|uniref:hypothetical protein n=1 Tax=Cesiribacter sp. SM1 TaxID=2861196 RepID=UPI001CD53706|nr:hypothetical protein [Cesiribacter sp. SM1]
MSIIQPDWNQERPDPHQINEMWNRMQIAKIDEWSDATLTLMQKIKETHINGGLQIHKYQITADKSFDWFVSRNRLDEIDFVQNLIRRPELQNYRNKLKIGNDTLVAQTHKWWTDIYDLPGELARILGQGGAYHKLEADEAWSTATNFVKEEFQNRFDEFTSFSIEIENADWFYNIAWDYSTLIFDKRTYQTVIIDITDTD